MEKTIDWTKAIPAFLGDRDAIIAHEHHQCVTFDQLAMGMYLGGGGHLFLRTAVSTWTSGVLTKPCPLCSSCAFVVYAGGSPLTGSGSWRGWCPSCGIVSKNESVTEIILHKEILGRWVPLGYQPVIQRGDPWIFDFKRGAVHTGLKREPVYHFVPSWLVFMTENYPECLIDDGTTS